MLWILILFILKDVFELRFAFLKRCQELKNRSGWFRRWNDMWRFIREPGPAQRFAHEHGPGL
jgi:hypothetical protein